VCPRVHQAYIETRTQLFYDEFRGVPRCVHTSDRVIELQLLNEKIVDVISRHLKGPGVIKLNALHAGIEKRKPGRQFYMITPWSSGALSKDHIASFFFSQDSDK